MILLILPVLYHEYDIEEDGHDAEHPLDDVEATTWERRLSMTDGLDHVLQHREESSREVQQNVLYWPSIGAFSLVVEVNLGHVLDKGDEGLAVASSTQESYVFIELNSGNFYEEDN